MTAFDPKRSFVKCSFHRSLTPCPQRPRVRRFVSDINLRGAEMLRANEVVE